MKSKIAFSLGLSLLLTLTSLAKASSDLSIMTKARTVFEKGNLDKAIEIYSSVPQDSDFWLEALEEKAWAHVRKSDYEKALADLKSATHPALASQVGPESLMLSSFVSLKICAYKDVLQKITLFKSRMLPKVEAMEKIVTDPKASGIEVYFNDLKGGKLAVAKLGKNAELFPRYFYRDLVIKQSLKAGKKLAVYNRLKVMAQNDLDEIEKNLKKMKLMEIEVLQRVSLQEPMISKKDLKFDGVNKNKQVSFPVEGDEFWLDEIGRYQVKSQGCEQQQKGVL